MHSIRKSLQLVRQFFSPAIQYSFVVAESLEDCLRKIQSGLPLKSKEAYSQRSLEQNQFFRITPDKDGDPQFEILVRRIDPSVIGSMVIIGRFSVLDPQRTLVFGEVRSWAFCFVTFMIVVVGSFMVAASCTGSLISLLFGLIIVPIAFYFNLSRRKRALFLIDTLKHTLES
ncbi:MAG: hypothetical protein HY862_02985 [Chloroflexi bacterium]|nr:hypothetical protein [Chloroflexota bacterium]